MGMIASRDESCPPPRAEAQRVGRAAHMRRASEFRPHGRTNLRSRRNRLAFEKTRAAERQPELVALLRVIGVDAELAQSPDAIHDRVAVHAEAVGGVTDAPAVQQRLKRRHELEPAVGCAHRERTEHPVGERAHRIVVVREGGEDSTSASVCTVRSG